MKAKKILSALVASTMALGVTAFAAVENEPKYTVENISGQTGIANTTAEAAAWKLEVNMPYELDFGMTFTAADDYETAQKSPYAKYNADFVITLSEAIDADDIALFGEYGTYGWLGAKAGREVAAGESVRLLQSFDKAMKYEEICLLVNKFNCGVDILDEEKLNDLKVTLELRLYETENVDGVTTETGEYFVVGSSYTFSASNEPTWIYDTDAGYVTDDNGIMRFMFSADVTGTVTESGVKFMTSDMEATQGDITSTTAGNTFYADVVNVPASAAGKTYYAKAYVKTENGSTYWSKALACTPNFSKLIAQ